MPQVISDTIIISEKNFIKYNDENTDYPMPYPHYHNYYEIYFMVHGKCTFSVEDRFFEINKNDMLIIPPGLIHKAEDYPQISKRIILNFSTDCISSELKKMLSKFRDNNFYVPGDAAYVLNFLENIQKELDNIDEISNNLKFCYLSILLAYLARNDSIAMYSSPPSRTIKLINSLIKYISDNYYNDITVKDLSEEFGYSPNYISFLFKQNIGIGFSKYLTLQRLKHAEYMLSSTDKSIQRIAMECGFSDSNYFSMTFKKAHGIPPTKYRNLR